MESLFIESRQVCKHGTYRRILWVHLLIKGLVYFNTFNNIRSGNNVFALCRKEKKENLKGGKNDE